MTRPRAHTRKYPPLGILIGVDDGLLECVPGGRTERGIDGPRITSIDARGDLAIASAPGDASSGGAWVHNGLRWRQVWSGDARCVQIGASHDGAIYPLYLSTGDGHLLRSLDEGATWVDVRGTTDLWRGGILGGTHGAHATSNAIAVTGVVEVRSPARGNAPTGTGGLVVAFDGGGTWFTPNDGDTWLRRGEGIDPAVQRLYRHPDIADRLYVTTASGMYRSTDEGYTWLQSLKDLDRGWGGSLAVLPGPTDSLVLSLARTSSNGEGHDGALFRSVNAGLTWARVLLDGVTGDEDEWERVPAVVGPRELDGVTFVAAGSRLHASHDRGRTWTPLAEGLPPANVLAASV